MASSPGSVITLGYAVTGATPSLVITLGYGAGAAVTTATITGTATASITEADIVAGGKTIIITLANDTWVTAGAAFNAQRQAIINGLDSAQSELTGWNALVRDAEVVTSVVRTSDTVVTITLSAVPLYNITASETVTVTVPSSALTTSLVDVTGIPAFTVSVVVPVGDHTGGKGDNRKRPQPFKPTGLLPRKKIVAKRLEESREIHQEVVREAKVSDSAPEISFKSIESMLPAEIDAEIGRLLRKKLNEDDLLIILLIGSIN